MKLAALASLVALLASCQSMSNGILSVEGRAIVLDDLSSENPFMGLSSNDIEADSWGVHGALSTPILDVIAGVDFREFEGADATELTAGLRHRFLEIWRMHPYVEGNLRFSVEDVDTGVTEEDYTGWNAAGGALLNLTDHIFLNLRIAYETADVGGNDVDGVIGTAGIGFSL